MNRTRNSAWSVATRLLFSATWVAAGLFATPWLLFWLGSERFGAYRILLDWMSYLALFELGLSGALMACLAPKVCGGDRFAVRRLLAAGLQAYLKVMVAMIAVGAGLVVALPYVVSLKAVSARELQVACLISLLPILLTPLSIFRSLAEARQRNYLFVLLMTGQTVLMTLLWLAAAWAGWGLPGQSLAAAIAQLPAVLILSWDGMRAYGPKLSVMPDPQSKRALWAISRPTFVNSVTERIGLISGNVIIGWILGPVAVVPFYLTQRLATLAQMQLQGFGESTWAGLVELYSQGETAIFRLRLLELTSTVSALGVAVLGPIVAYNGHFIELWVGSDSYAGEAVNVISCVNIWLSSLYSLWAWSLLGTGYIGLWVPYVIVFTLVSLTVSILGTLTFGIVGPLLGILTGLLVVNSWALPKVLQQAFGILPFTLWRTALAPLPWGVSYAIILWMLGRSHTPWGWSGLAFEVGLSGVGGLALWWTLSLNQDARTQWRYRLRSALNLY